ncbi:MAG: hypothetical protein ACK5M7_07605 [Draconibacterium sp.]
MKNLILVPLLFLAVLTSAQSNYQINSLMEFMRVNKMAVGEKRYITSEADIQGSPYLDDEFIAGSVYTTTKFQYNDIPLRYNIYSDNVEFKTPDNTVLAIASPETIEKITFGGNTIEYIPYINVKKERNGYFLLASKGKASLYIRPEVIYKKPTVAEAYKDPEPAKFERRNDVFFIRIGTQAAQRIEKKKDLTEVFPDHQKEIESFVKKNKTSPDKLDELTSLIAYYNSL